MIERFLFRSVSIIDIEKIGKTIIFICDTEDKSNELFEFIKSNRYRVNGMLTTNRKVKIVLEFLEWDDAMGFNTEMTVQQYPPYGWLMSGAVKNLTTGVKYSHGHIEWIEDYLPLFSPILN